MYDYITIHSAKAYIAYIAYIASTVNPHIYIKIKKETYRLLHGRNK